MKNYSPIIRAGFIFLVAVFIFALFVFAPAAQEPDILLEKSEEVFSYVIHNTRDPFLPLVSADGYVVNFEPQTEISDIHLEGITFDPEGKSFVVINGNVIGENESVGNFKLKEIKKDKIILQNGQNSHIIELIKEDAGEQK